MTASSGIGLAVLLLVSSVSAPAGSPANPQVTPNQLDGSGALSFEFYDFFQVPYGEWWDMRYNAYGDLPINAECFNQTSIADGLCVPSNGNVKDYETYPYTNWDPLPGQIRPGNPANNPLVYAPYRLRATGANLSGYNLSEPVFFPVLDYGEPAGSRLDFRWRMQYLDVATGRDLTGRGCPGVDPRFNDGFQIRSQISLTLDLQESKRVFGVVASDAPTARGWWSSNTDNACATERTAETNLDSWFVQMGGGAGSTGKYDIVNGFEYQYTPFYTNLTASVDDDGTTHVYIEHAAWGTEVLLGRMFYWGNASYKDDSLNSSRAEGWWGMEPAWLEDMDFEGSLEATTFTFTLSATQQYHFLQLSDPGPDGALDRVDDLPYWQWGPVLTDYTNDYSPNHLVSELDRYPSPYYGYVHTTPGSARYGQNLSYDYVPLRWDLDVNESWHFQFPSIDVVFYDPNNTPIGADPRFGSYVEIGDALAPMRTQPAGYGVWEPMNDTWDVLGPAATGGPNGSPGPDGLPGTPDDRYALEPWGSLLLGPRSRLNLPPTASFDVSPAAGNSTTSFLVDASASYDVPDPGSALQVRWDWEDDGLWDTDWSTEKQARHVYGAEGSYTIRVEVLDTTALTGQATHRVDVDDTPPVTAVGLDGSAGGDGWYRSAVVMTLSATDDRSGVASISYRIDGGSWQSYVGPVTIDVEGDRAFDYRSTDAAGNAEPIQTVRIKIDLAPPVAVHTLAGILGSGGWYVTPVSVQLSASDNASGLAAIEYRIDGGSWQLYTSPVSLLDGQHVFEYYGVDVAGWQQTIEQVPVHVDTTGPQTSVLLSGSSGTNGWYVSSVLATLSAADADSGVVAVSYRLDGGGWQSYASAVAIAGDGTHVLEVFAQDAAGNSEAIQRFEVKIDTTPPIVYGTLDGVMGRNGWFISLVTLTLVGSDATSGVDSISFSVDGGVAHLYSGPISIAIDGPHSLNLGVIDRAGLLGDSSSLSFRIDRTPPTTDSAITGTPGANGWYVSDAIVTLQATDATSGVTGIEYRVDSGPWQTYGAGVPLTDGDHRFEYRATDAAGLVEPIVSLPVRVDETNPNLASLSPTGLVTTAILTISWSGSDATSGIAYFEIGIDGGAFQSVGTQSSASVSLSDGIHVVRVRAVDNAGNTAAAETQVRVDTNIFSLSGPYAGVPTFALLAFVVAVIALVFVRRRRKRS